MEQWHRAEDVYAAKARFEAAIPGWVAPAAYALGVRHPDGSVTWPVVNHPNVHQLPGVVLATVVAHRGGTATYVLDTSGLDRAIAMLEPAGACDAFEHPNLWAWQRLRAELVTGAHDGSTVVAAFVADVADPIVDGVDAELRRHLAPAPDAPAARPLPATITGPAVTLRAWTPIDAAVLHELVLANLDHLRPWLPWTVDEPLTVDERRRSIETWDRARRDGGDAVYAITVHGRAVGCCGLHPRIARSGLEVGYWLAAAHTGRGHGTEAARLLTATALAIDGITHVEIHHDRANERSAAIPRRLGFVRVDERPSVVQRAPEGDGVTVVWRTWSVG